MAAPRRLVRVALEIEETDLEEIQRLIESYNSIFSPLKLNRTELIRTAIREKMAQLRAQLTQINRS